MWMDSKWKTAEARRQPSSHRDERPTRPTDRREGKIAEKYTFLSISSPYKDNEKFSLAAAAVAGSQRREQTRWCVRKTKEKFSNSRARRTNKEKSSGGEQEEGKRRKKEKANENALCIIVVSQTGRRQESERNERYISKFSSMPFSTTFPRCSDDMIVQHSPTTENLSPSFLSSCVIVVADVDVQQTIFTRLAAPARWMHYSNHPNCMSGMAINAVKRHPLKSKILNWIFSLLFRVFFTCCRLVRPTMTLLNCIE